MCMKKISVFFAFFCILLSACGGAGKEETPLPADPETQAQLPPPSQIIRPLVQTPQIVASAAPAPAPLYPASTPSPTASIPASPVSTPSPTASIPAPPASTPSPTASIPAPPASTPSPSASIPTPPASTPSQPVAPGQVNSVYSEPSLSAKQGADAVYQLLSAERSRCGFTPIQRDAKLDIAARSHALWILKNWVSSHTETPGTPGFTGVEVGDRADAVDYDYRFIGEILNTQFFANSTEVPNWRIEGVTRMRSLMAAPYHMTGAFGGYHSVGISIAVSAANPLADLNQTRRGAALVVNLGSDARKHEESLELQTDGIVTYPCQGTTATATKLSSEFPNPVPGRNLGRNPVGQPIMVVAGKKKVLTLDDATIHDALNQTLVLLPILNHASDKNEGLATDTAFLIPDSPLLPNSRYTVHVRGSSGSTPFDSTFSFTTGN